MDLWMEPEATYLTDLRHPVARREYEAWARRNGLRYNYAMSARERRDFDRYMVNQYGGRYPLPPVARWKLLAYDILDQDEERRQKEAAASG